MKEYKSLSHTRWDCKYHVVFIPKYRRKKMYGAIRTHLGKILHELAKQKESLDSGRGPSGRKPVSRSSELTTRNGLGGLLDWSRS